MVLYGKSIEDDQIITIHIEEEKISQIVPLKMSEFDNRDTGLYISPGFFDPQVNGFAGIDFNSQSLTPEDLHRAAQAILTTGVTTFFPTLITASFNRLIHQLKILKDAIERDSLVLKMCKGIHLEGPYISSLEGPRGVHSFQHIRPPSWDEFEKFQEACEGRIKLITLAPEKEGGIKFIERAVLSGVVVAIGHTAASDEMLEVAFQAGARLSTHLGNGIGNLKNQPHNPFQKQLKMDGLMASIIVDGIHLSDDVVKNIVKAKTPENVLLCTDVISAAFQPSGRYGLGDLEIEAGEGGRTRLFKTGSLAGSTLTMPKAIANTIKLTGVDLRTSIKMATENGRKLFPEMIGTLASGQPANLVFFRFDGEVRIEKTILIGGEVYPNLNSKLQIPNRFQ